MTTNPQQFLEKNKTVVDGLFKTGQVEPDIECRPEGKVHGESCAEHIFSRIPTVEGP